MPEMSDLCRLGKTRISSFCVFNLSAMKLVLVSNLSYLHQMVPCALVRAKLKVLG